MHSKFKVPISHKTSIQSIIKNNNNTKHTPDYKIQKQNQELLF